MPFIEREQGRIHYEERGTGEPLLLLMGLGADLSAWAPHRQVYEKYFRCISMDNRGAGASELGEAEACSTKAMAEDAAALLDVLELRGVRVAGISMGGAIAQFLAAFRPELVSRLLLVNTFARPTAYMKRVMGTFKACYPVLASLEFDRLLQEFIYGASTFSERPEVFEERERGLEVGTRMEAKAFLAQCDACIGHDALPYLKEIRAKTLVAAGDEDILTPLMGARLLKDGIPEAELYVGRGGHVQHFEDLENFNRVSLEFLKRE